MPKLPQILSVPEKAPLYGSCRLVSRKERVCMTCTTATLPAELQGISYVIRGEKSYELSNHLGNVLAVVSDRREAGSCTDFLVDFYYADGRSVSDYYPFGMCMDSRTQSAGGYRWGFNGQEKDDEIAGEGNTVYFNFRVIDARLGRFLSIDPLKNSFPFSSPYAFCLNSPIKFSELEGAEIKVAGTAANDLVTMYSMRSGLKLSLNANGFLIYQSNVLKIVGAERNGFLLLESEPAIKTTGSEFTSRTLAQLLISLINGGEGLDPIEIIALTSDEIKKMSPLQLDEIGFDQFPGENPARPQFDNVVDVTDFQNLGSQPVFQAAMLGHLLAERGIQTKSNLFNDKHKIGIAFETRIIQEGFPDLQITSRIIGNETSMDNREIFETGLLVTRFFDYSSVGFVTLGEEKKGVVNVHEIKGVAKVEGIE